jgi:hypothetical protein
LTVGIALRSLASFVRPWSAKPTKSAHDGDGTHNNRLFGVSSYIGCEERVVLNEGAVERGGLLGCLERRHRTNAGGIRRETYNVESSEECRFIVSARLPQHDVSHQ